MCPSASLDQGLFHSKRGSEQNQPPAIPLPLCLAWGLTFHTQRLRAWPWEPACLEPVPGPTTCQRGKSLHFSVLCSPYPHTGTARAPSLCWLRESVSVTQHRAWPRLDESHFHTLMGMGVMAHPGPASLWDEVFCHCSAKWTAETGEKERTLQDSFLKILHVLLSCPQRGGLSRNQEK